MAACSYEDQTGVAPAFRCPPCSGPVEYRVRDYFRGPAREQLGPDMGLCVAHAAWYAKGSLGLAGYSVEHKPPRGPKVAS